MSKTHILKVSRAIVVAGDIVHPGQLIEVTASEARDLVRRGRAVHHGEVQVDEQPDHEQKHEPEIDTIQPDAEPDAEPEPRKSNAKAAKAAE